MRTVDPEKHKAKQQGILTAAKACFIEHGFHKTSTEMIRIKAGISSGSLFHYFPNKKAIVLAVVEAQRQETAAFMDMLASQPDMVAACKDFMDTIAHLAADTAECRLVLEISAEAARDEEVAALSRAGDRVLQAGIVTLIGQGIERGQIAPQITSFQLTSFIMVLVDGIFSRASSDPDFDPLREAEGLSTILKSVLGANHVR